MQRRKREREKKRKYADEKGARAARKNRQQKKRVDAGLSPIALEDARPLRSACGRSDSVAVCGGVCAAAG